jgi:hypothetical protein
MKVVVLNCWVTETKLTPCASKTSDHFRKVHQGTGEPIDLVDDQGIDFMFLNITEKLPQGGPLHRTAGEAAVVVMVGHDGPALMLLTLDECAAGLSLGIERIEGLFETLL